MAPLSALHHTADTPETQAPSTPTVPTSRQETHAKAPAKCYSLARPRHLRLEDPEESGQGALGAETMHELSLLRRYDARAGGDRRLGWMRMFVQKEDE